jgi:hypothetical protein
MPVSKVGPLTTRAGVTFGLRDRRCACSPARNLSPDNQRTVTEPVQSSRASRRGDLLRSRGIDALHRHIDAVQVQCSAPLRPQHLMHGAVKLPAHASILKAEFMNICARVCGFDGITKIRPSEYR